MAKYDTILGIPAAGFGFLVVLLLFALSQSFVVIEPGERGVSVTLGTVDPAVRHEGLTMKVPFIEQIYRYSIKQNTVKGIAECYSQDLQNVDVEYKAFYALPPDKVVMLHRSYQGDPYNSVVDPLIQDALKQVVSNYRAEDAVKRREEVRRKATEIVVQELRDIVSNKTKDEKSTPLVSLIEMPITNIQLTDKLEHEIEEKQIMEQQAQAKVYELQKKKKEAEIAYEEAKALEARGRALQSSPDLLKLEMKKLELEMMEKVLKKWNGVSPQTVVVGEKDSNVLLPLK